MRCVPGPLWPCAGAFVLALAIAPTAHAQGGWSPKDLGTLGGTTSWASDINDAGHVVGSASTDSGFERAFLWTPDEGMRDLGTLGGNQSGATDINNAGQVVGSSGYYVVCGSCYAPQHAFLWTEAGMVDLGTLGGPESVAMAINADGVVVGASTTASGYWHAFRWTADEGMQDLGTLGGNQSWASDINDVGQVVGLSEYTIGCAPQCAQHAFRWAAEAMTDLGTLGGTRSSASRLNNAGHVVGSSQTASGDTQGFLWTAEGGMVAPFGTLGGADSLAYDINDAGQVVGRSLIANGDRHPFVWTAAGGMIDLGTLGGAVGFAYGINEGGQVVGRSETVADGPQTATLWSDATTPPSPEEQIDSLMASIDDLVAEGSLRPGQASGLTRPLRNALRSLEGEHLASACSQLDEFQIEVSRKVVDGALTAEEGTVLISAAASIRRGLGC